MKRQSIAHGDYSNTAICWIKVTVIFCGIFGILFCRTYLFIPQFLTKPRQFSVEPWLGNTVLEPEKGPTTRVIPKSTSDWLVKINALS